MWWELFVIKHPCHTRNYNPSFKMGVRKIVSVDVIPKINEKFPSDDTLFLKFASSDLDSGKHVYDDDDEYYYLFLLL